MQIGGLNVKKGISRIKVFFVGLLVGIALCVAAAIGMNMTGFKIGGSQETLSPSVVFDRIVSRDELVTASQDYQIVDKVTDANSFFDLFDIPFTENSFWYRYAGTIKAGVNLKTAEFKADGGTITVTLDDPYIISNEPDMDKSGALEENNNILNPIHVQDVDSFQRKCKEESEKQVTEDGGLFNEAKANAEANIRAMFTAALGSQYQVEFSYR